MGMSIVTQTEQDVKVFLCPYEDTFRAWLEEHDRSPKTVRLYMTGLRDFTTWFESATGRALDPALITPLDVRSYRTHLMDERKAANSVNSYMAAVRAFCKWAAEGGLTTVDPTRGVKGVKIVEQAPRWLSRQEQYAILRAAQERVQLGDLRADDEFSPGYVWPRRDVAIIVLMLNAGLRLSEVAALQVDDVVIRPRSGNVTVRSGKGRKTRVVPLNKDAREALKAWIEVRAKRAAEGVTALFLSQKGGALTARAVARVVETVGDRANVKVTPHMLRHSLAKNLVDQGVSLDQVGMALGHESLDTTKRYTMPSQADMQAALERVAWSD